MNKFTIGENIKKQMKLHGMDNVDLANAANVARYSTIGNWISGQRQPSAYALYRLSKVFGVSMEELMEGIEDE